MAFHETPRFPNVIARNMRGGPEGRTTVVTLASGDEERASPWAGFRHRYDVAQGVRCADHLETVKAYFFARHGKLHGFRIKDFADYKSCAPSAEISPTDQVLVSDGASPPAWQLVKVYTSGAQSYTRTILKPVAGTVRVAVDGVEQMSGWAVDTTTGLVTFDVPPTGSPEPVVTAGFEFDVPVRFDTDSIAVTFPTSAESYADLGEIPLIEVRR